MTIFYSHATFKKENYKNKTTSSLYPFHSQSALIKILSISFYFGGAWSKGFAALRNVSTLQFFDKIGQAKSVGFRLYSAIWRSERRNSSRYLEITSISLIYSLTFLRKKELLFGLPGVWTDSPVWPVRSEETLSLGISQLCYCDPR